jgi:hypothetical protein
MKNEGKRAPGQKRQKTKSDHIKAHKRSREPVDYGVTKKQFFGILEKVSRLAKKSD